MYDVLLLLVMKQKVKEKKKAKKQKNGSPNSSKRRVLKVHLISLCQIGNEIVAFPYSFFKD